MTIIDNRTEGREYHLPSPTNKLKDDVLRDILAKQAIDADITAILLALAGKAAAEHAHVIPEITGLADALEGKISVGYHDALGDLSDVSVSGATNGQVLIRQATQWIPVALQIGNVTGLEAAISPLVAYTAQTRTEDERSRARANIGLGEIGLLIKADPRAVAFTKTGAGTASIKAGTLVEVSGKLFSFAGATAITMPALAAGTDYAIWIKPDGTVEATADHVSPPVASSRKIGGFHYAPGGNAAAQAGGNTTAQINEYSFWDLHFRPACLDPRGMALVAGSFWVDIYLLGVNHHTDGTSRYNVTIADGSSPPKIPVAFGGNGSSIYSTLNWWEAAEVMQSHGKQLLDVAEFGAATFGTTEATSGVTDPVSTILRAAYTSKWGVMLATGNLWVWGRDFGGNFGTAAYTANGRGSTHTLSNAALLGGSWAYGANSGSRSSSWDTLPSNSPASVGARGRCDHLCHV